MALPWPKAPSCIGDWDAIMLLNNSSTDALFQLELPLAMFALRVKMRLHELIVL